MAGFILSRGKKAYHPAKLIALQCVLVGTVIYNNLFRFLICPSKLPFLLAYTNPETLYHALTDEGVSRFTDQMWSDRRIMQNILLLSQLVFVRWFQVSKLLCIMCISLDLVLTIRNPFYPKDWRTIRIYLPLSVCTGFLYGATYGMIFSNIQNIRDSDQRFEKASILAEIDDTLILLLTVINLILIVVCAVYAQFQLRKPGIN